MNLLQRIKNLFGKKQFSPNWQALSGQTLGTYDAFHSKPEPTKTDFVYAFNDIVYSVSSLIASTCAATHIKLFVKTDPHQARPKCQTKKVERRILQYLWETKSISRGTTVDEVVSHPLITLLAKNYFHNYHELVESTELYLEITGNAYWLIDFDDYGLPDHITMLPSHQVIPLRDERRIIIAYKFGVGMDAPEYPVNRIIHFKFPSLIDPYGEGTPPLRGAWQRYQISLKELGYLDATLSNMAIPSAILAPTGENYLGQFEAERLAKDFMQKFRNAGNGGIMVADGPMSVTPLNFSPKDMAGLQLYQVLKTSICNAYAVPPDLFELGESNRATADAAIYSLSIHCIRPRMFRLIEKLNERLVPFFDDRLFFAASEIVPEDRAFDLQQSQALLQAGAVTRNEVRTKYGYDPAPWGDDPLLPPGAMPLGTMQDDSQGEAEIPTPALPSVTTPLVDAKPDGGADDANALRATVGGSQQVMAMQQAYYAGAMPREAAIANAKIVFGFSEAEAEALFPEIPPKVMTEQAPVEPQPKSKALDTPDLRQSEPYDCGAIATKIVCDYFGLPDMTEADYIAELGTTEEDGTPPENIMAYLEHVGLTIKARNDLTIGDLAQAAGQTHHLPPKNYSPDA